MFSSPLDVIRPQNYCIKRHFFLDKATACVKFKLQSESVTLSVDYLISSAQAGSAPAWVFLLGLWGADHEDANGTLTNRE
jgi:hypothetical protein